MARPFHPRLRVTLVVLAVAIASFALAMANDHKSPGRIAQTPTTKTSTTTADSVENSGGQAAGGRESPQQDIRKLNQHFNKPGNDLSPWMFVPQENIKELSTEEHPGLVTLWEAGKGDDIKGLLTDPIRIDDYPLPWQFQ